MSRFASTYPIGRSTGVCAETGEPIPPTMPFVAVLCERPDEEGFERLDYSLAAWEAGARPEHLFSFWKTQAGEGGGKERVLVDDEVLMDIFERLAEDERPQRQAFRFVLALILMRKRLLRFIDRVPAQGDEPAKWRMKPRGADPEAPPIEVVNPELGDEDVRELTAQLGEVLQGDFE